MNKLVLMVATACLVSACGSGSDTRTAPPPSPPPPPSNAAPNAVITGPSAPLSAGSVVEFSASSSTDPDGDTLSFTWELSGAVTESYTTETISVELPFLGEPDSLSLSLTVSDGSLSNRASDTLTVDLARTSIATLLADASVVEGPTGLTVRKVDGDRLPTFTPANGDTISDTRAPLVFSEDPATGRHSLSSYYYSESQDALVEAGETFDEFLEPLAPFEVLSDGDEFPFGSPILVEPRDNRLVRYSRQNESTGTPHGRTLATQVSADSPCTLRFSYYFSPARVAIARDIDEDYTNMGVVGQVDTGLTLYRAESAFDFFANSSPEVRATLRNGKSYCAVLPHPVAFDEPFVGQGDSDGVYRVRGGIIEGTPLILAVDTATNTLDLIEFDSNSNSLTVIASEPIVLPTGNPTFVDVSHVGNAETFANSSAMILVFANASGQQAAVLAGVTKAREIDYEIFTWDGAEPNSVNYVSNFPAPDLSFAAVTGFSGWMVTAPGGDELIAFARPEANEFDPADFPAIGGFSGNRVFPSAPLKGPIFVEAEAGIEGFAQLTAAPYTYTYVVPDRNVVVGIPRTPLDD